jgi:CRISPR type III-B/RAMP module RAMP protein Cmr6
MLCCRKSIERLELQKGGNAGLLLSSYLKNQKQDGSSTGEEDREELFTAAINAAKESNVIYKVAYERRKRFIHGSCADFNIDVRMIIGLGANNVLESGLTLNHIYGVPIIPGNALKGLAAHYCSSVIGKSNPNFKGPERDEKKGGIVLKRAGESYEFIFGKIRAKSDSDCDEEAGFITFHDAWIKPESLPESLHFDVMTPHHQEYYNGSVAPTDFDSPNPVSFLSVGGKFEIIVSCDGEEDNQNRKSWEKIALDFLKRALSEFGIGGKTNSGYGIGTLEYKDNSRSERENVNNDGAVATAQLFSPGQQVEAIYKSTNKKGNHQIEVSLNSETIAARWEGDTLSVPKGTKFQAIIKSYNPSSNPKLILTDKL